MSILDTQVSMFRNAFQKEPSEDVTLREFIDRIKRGEYGAQIKAVRQAKFDPERYAKIKPKLPAVTLSALLKHRRQDAPLEEKLISHSGLLQIDLDKVPDLHGLREKINADPFTLFSFVSPGGDGLKIIVRIDPAKHLESFQFAERYYRDKFAVTIDPSVKDVTRLCFVSHDPFVFVNEEAQVIPAADCQQAPKETTRATSASKFSKRAFDAAGKIIRDSTDGRKHFDLYKASRLLGGYVAGGVIPRSDAAAFLQAEIQAKPNVHSLQGAFKTIEDGLNDGLKSPIELEVLEKERCSFLGRSEHSEHSEHSEQYEQNEHFWASSEQFLSKSEQAYEQKVSNIAGEIRKWVMESNTSFTTEDVDKEFCLRSRREKQARSDALYRLLKRKLIFKDKIVRGRWHPSPENLDQLDLDTDDDPAFEISLPLDLSSRIIIPPKSIVVVAGSTNAGKTALLLNIASMNLKAKPLYLFSEMGPGEFKNRLRCMNHVPWDEWKQMRCVEMTSGFFGTIHAHNPDGITFIDYLEEIQGDFYKVPAQIREIYDALGNGITFIGLQKNSNQTFAKGGEGTAEKARLYIAMDNLCQTDSGAMCSVKILKAKHYLDRNPNGLEIHCKITKSGVSPLNDWTRMDAKERERWVTQYQAGLGARRAS